MYKNVSSLQAFWIKAENFPFSHILIVWFPLWLCEEENLLYIITSVILPKTLAASNTNKMFVQSQRIDCDDASLCSQLCYPSTTWSCNWSSSKGLCNIRNKGISVCCFFQVVFEPEGGINSKYLNGIKVLMCGSVSKLHSSSGIFISALIKLMGFHSSLSYVVISISLSVMDKDWSFPACFCQI